ncbi:MAG: hypothetical protein COA90_02150 [Gammaproteobacteria bacterium]|nr:MAG: hypothetical protein COA90_02150 [Gammaproteobacteria bacterium]
MMHTALIVDDSKLARDILRKLLQDAGVNIINEAVNGLDGYKMYQQYKPSLLICDIEMPKITGLKLVEKIRETDSEIQIIVASSVRNSTTIKKLIYLGSQILKKPITETAFTQVFNNLTSARDMILRSEKWKA